MGDTPVEYIGPVVETQWRGRGVRVRISDVASGDPLADDCDKIRRS
ncbi:MAG: hypothetical protein IPN34_01010 [Planctomycetes bacterium]|nr:hypothetical protein [Planctomycetota bacterium]